VGILVECPKCKVRGSVKRKVCKCGNQVQKSDSKNYWIDYYLNGKRTRERIGRSKQAAENRLREVETAKAEGNHIKKNRSFMISLGEIYKWYLDLPEVKSLSSYNTLKGRLWNPVHKIGNKLRISELSLELIRQFSVSRSQEPSPWKKQNHIATATIHKEISSLKSMLNTAVRYNKIETNPIKDASMPKLSNSRMLSISHYDFMHLLECAEEHIKPVLTMAYYEPMRKDEIIRLTWKEIDIKAGFIRLAASRTKGGIEGRSIPIHPAVRKMLSLLPRSFQSNRVFLRRVNGQYEQFNDFRKSWKSARKKAGLDDFVFHDFRHVAISNLRKAGNSPTVIMKASGHKTMSMFLRYNLVDEEDLKGMRWIERKTESDTKDISAKMSA